MYVLALIVWGVVFVLCVRGGGGGGGGRSICVYSKCARVVWVLQDDLIVVLLSALYSEIYELLLLLFFV